MKKNIKLHKLKIYLSQTKIKCKYRGVFNL